MNRQQKGFTLIELVIVIVILGILAAAALPRFADLSSDARISSVNGLAGGLRSAAAIAKATQSARSLQSNVSVVVDGVVIQMQSGYPNADNISTALTDFTGFTLTATATVASFVLRSNCEASYTESTGLGYTVSTRTAGC